MNIIDQVVGQSRAREETSRIAASSELSCAIANLISSSCDEYIQEEETKENYSRVIQMCASARERAVGTIENISLPLSDFLSLSVGFSKSNQSPSWRERKVRMR